MRIFYYKMTTDNGGAPCVTPQLLTLAICKPKIRSVAQKRDIVFGFGSKKHGEKLIYIAIITGKIINGEYYRNRDYITRGDCIYKWDKKSLNWKKGSRYHKNGMRSTKDIGSHPKYENTIVLLSKNFRYFGNNKLKLNARRYPKLCASVSQLKSGHRVNHTKKMASELTLLQKQLWNTHRKMKCGDPTDTKLCGDISSPINCSGIC